VHKITCASPAPPQPEVVCMSAAYQLCCTPSADRISAATWSAVWA